MERQQTYSINLQKIQAHMTRYSRDVHPIILQQSGRLTPEQDELQLIYDTLLSLQTSLARDMAVLQLHLRNALNQPTQRGDIQHTSQPLFIHNLSCKEQQVLTMFAKGYSYTEAADLLGCKLATVQTHTKRIYKKLNVHSRSEAVFEARQLGLIQV